MYAEPKARACDIDYIKAFELSQVQNLFRSSWPFRTARFLRSAAVAVIVFFVWVLASPQIARNRVSAPEQELLSED